MAFASKEDLLGLNPDRNSEIYFFDGNALRQVTHTSPQSEARRLSDGSFQPSISNDGQFIAFASNRNLVGLNADLNLEIFLFETVGQNLTQPTSSSNSFGATNPKISGDSSRIAFVSSDTETNNRRDMKLYDRRSAGTQLLVATTVIEVGVDVPAATVMVIEHAERFGLSQLHQLRGRVGRGRDRSTCLLLYRAPLGETAKARLAIMRDTEDGFRIAEEDLRLRGEGDLLGTRQSGVPGFRVGRIEVHGKLIPAARDDAALILSRDPNLASPRGEALRHLLYLFERDEAIRLLRAG